ncbi:heavy metal-binding domain-containing protein [Salmonella enterica subsp. enterica]|nr:heavy metal-binding domain-containing protein [Salmonella enterica subsp. enterica]
MGRVTKAHCAKVNPLRLRNQRFSCGIQDIVGGRSGAYERTLRKAREIAFQGNNRFF